MVLLRKNIFKTIGVALVAVLLVAYISVQAVNALTAYKTEMAVMHSAYDSIECNGFIIRNESVLSGGENGILRYVLKDGERVSKNGVVAEIYSTEEAVYAKEEYDELTERINRMEESERQAKGGSINLETINTQSRSSLLDMLSAFDNGDMDSVYDISEEYLDLINRRQILTGDLDGYGTLISELKSQRDAAAAKMQTSSSSIRSANSGYFIKSIDGYENSISVEELANITPDMLNSVTATDMGDAIGKVVGDYDWYIATEIDNTAAMSLAVGQTYSIDFNVSTAEKVPATVKYMNRFDNTTVVVFSCSYMNSTLAHLRSCQIEVILKEYNGLIVNTDAVRIADDVKGVYVDNGYMIKFKPIEVIYTGDGYMLCKVSEDKSGLVLYDEVIIGGRNLYDGKIVA